MRNVSKLLSKHLSKSIHLFTSLVYLFTFLGPNIALATYTGTDTEAIQEDSLLGHKSTKALLTPSDPASITLTPVAQKSLMSFEFFLDHLEDHKEVPVTILEGDTIEDIYLYDSEKFFSFYYRTPRGFWPFVQLERIQEGPQRIQRLFKKANGDFSTFFDFEIDYAKKVFTLLNYKGPKVEFELAEYAVKFGDFSTKAFANIICTDSQLSVICKSFNGDYSGIDAPNFRVSAGDQFAFGSAHESQESISVNIADRTVSQSFTYHTDAGCYAKVPGQFLVASPKIHFNFGDLSCGTLMTVPPTYFEKMTALTWFESDHRNFGIQDLTVRAAHIFVKGAWHLLAKDCKIQADLNRFNFYVDEKHMRYGHEVQLPNSRHPLVSHREIYYAYATMQVSGQNNFGGHGFETRNAHPESAGKPPAIFPFKELIETDPLLETYYPLPSFLGSYSEKGVKNPQYHRMLIYLPVNKPYETQLYIPRSKPGSTSVTNMLTGMRKDILGSSSTGADFQQRQNIMRQMSALSTKAREKEDRQRLKDVREARVQSAMGRANDNLELVNENDEGSSDGRSHPHSHNRQDIEKRFFRVALPELASRIEHVVEQVGKDIAKELGVRYKHLNDALDALTKDLKRAALSNYKALREVGESLKDAWNKSLVLTAKNFETSALKLHQENGGIRPVFLPLIPVAAVLTSELTLLGAVITGLVIQKSVEDSLKRSDLTGPRVFSSSAHQRDAQWGEGHVESFPIPDPADCSPLPGYEAPDTEGLDDLPPYVAHPDDFASTRGTGETGGYHAHPDANAPRILSTPALDTDLRDSIFMNENGGSGTWSRVPKSLQDEMALEAAKRGEGLHLKDIELGDPRYKGMHKMQLKIKSDSGKDSVIHYVVNPETGEVMDFKFKKHSAD